MCGISGFWFPNQKLTHDDEINLHGMLALIRHRGPDGAGTWIESNRGLALGHARLSIIDLAGGCQPLISMDGRHVLTANGEFYDYKRHRARLMADGARFRTKSDSEIALGYYAREDLEMMRHLRGEFAFALYDRQRGRLVLVRDRFGIKPLFYKLTSKGLYYSSEVKGILAHPDVTRRLDPQATLHQLMHTMVSGTSAFEGVRAVRPGHMLIVEPENGSLRVREEKYWDVDFPKANQRDTSISAEEHVERIREEMIEAVTLRLEADVPVGCYLSGGIDSCSILGLASAAQQSPVKAFTISFDNDDYDEASIATEMAVSMNAEQELLNLKADDLYGENYLRTMWNAERTFYNTLGVAKWCMSRRVHECGYKVVVTGEGSDELFGGYPSFKRDMFLHGLKDEDPETVKAFQDALYKSNRIFKGAILAEEDHHHPAFESRCGFTPSWIQPWMITLGLARPLLHPDRRTELKDYDPITALAESLEPTQLEGRHPLDIAQYSWIKTMLECQILNWGGDRVDMANSMESRPAFLDHYVAAAAREVPPALRIKGAVEKWVLREAMKGVLPEILYKREKFAFMAPPGHTGEKKRSALESLIDDYLSPDAVKDAGIFDPKAMETFITEYRDDTDVESLTRKDALLNHLLGLQILHHQFIAEDLPAKARREIPELGEIRRFEPESDLASRQ